MGSINLSPLSPLKTGTGAVTAMSTHIIFKRAIRCTLIQYSPFDWDVIYRSMAMPRGRPSPRKLPDHCWNGTEYNDVLSVVLRKERQARSCTCNKRSVPGITAYVTCVCVSTGTMVTKCCLKQVKSRFVGILYKVKMNIFRGGYICVLSVPIPRTRFL
jgi:hypothetical protein